MIVKSLSLERALKRETVRRAGSLAQFVYYHGAMPPSCEERAEGERIGTGITRATETEIRMLAMHRPAEPMTPPGCYWRLIDNDGNCVMQGDGK